MKLEILGKDIRINKRMTEFVNERLAICNDHFGNRIRRMTVTLYSETGLHSAEDKRCRITYRLTGSEEGVVETSAEDLRSAIIAATHSVEHVVARRLDRRRTRRNDEMRKSRKLIWSDFQSKEGEAVGI